MKKVKALFYQAWLKHLKLLSEWKKLSKKKTVPYNGTFNTNLKKLKFLDGAHIKGSCKIIFIDQKNPSTWLSFTSSDVKNMFFHVPHGYLTIKYSDGDVYSGFWKNGSYFSRGEYFNHKSGTYIGTWDNGQMNGWGEYKFLNGDKYIGEFKNHNMHGLGTIKKAKGKIFRGYFIDGKFKKKLDDSYTIQKDDEEFTYK
tara:strand:- start:92 stop:685 length:594 start_codon:yes stop_codon:yes gene_type:complete